MTKIDHTVCMLNIGLNVSDADGNLVRTLTAHEALCRLRECGVKVNNRAQHNSATERTLVAHGVVPSAMAVDSVARALGQDCIAVWNVEQQAGELIGPRADKWGQFDPARFLLLDGSRLA